MNLGNRLACATSCYGFQVNFEDTVNHISNLGFQNIEIMAIPNWFEHLKPEEMNKEDLLNVKELLNTLNIKPIALSGHCELGHRNESSRLKERISLAATLDINQVVCGSGEITNVEEENQFYKSLEENIAFAEENNIILTLETGGNFIPTGKKLSAILKDFNSPYLGATFDPANVLTSSKVDPIKDIEYVLPYLSHIHIKEFKNHNKDYPPIGEGIIDFNSLFLLLYKEEYNGKFSFEVDCFKCHPTVANRKIEKSIAYMKNNTVFFDYFM